MIKRVQFQNVFGPNVQIFNAIISILCDVVPCGSTHFVLMSFLKLTWNFLDFLMIVHIKGAFQLYHLVLFLGNATWPGTHWTWLHATYCLSTGSLLVDKERRINLKSALQVHPIFLFCSSLSTFTFLTNQTTVYSKMLVMFYSENDSLFKNAKMEM